MTLPVHLPDPRNFPPSSSKIHDLAQALLSDHTPGALIRNEAALDQAIVNLLGDAQSSVADLILNAPTTSIAQCIQSRVNHIVTVASGKHATVFAIPLVMVVGVRSGYIIPGQLGDIDAVKALLTEYGIVSKDADIYLSPKLVDLNQMNQITANQLMRWRDVLQYASGGIPHEFNSTPIKVDSDGVVLRFLAGVAMQTGDSISHIDLNVPAGPWAMALSKLIGEQLAHPSLTLFPLPRAPQGWISAISDGAAAQKRVRFEVVASEILRKLRTDGETPVAVISAHENGDLRVTIGSETNGETWEGYVWPLSPLDRVDSVENFFLEVLQECRVEKIRVLSNILPTIKDQLPYFPLPIELGNETPPMTARH